MSKKKKKTQEVEDLEYQDEYYDDEEDEEYEYVDEEDDEDEYEYVYVDEDGNEIDPDDLDAYTEDMDNEDEEDSRSSISDDDFSDDEEFEDDMDDIDDEEWEEDGDDDSEFFDVEEEEKVAEDKTKQPEIRRINPRKAKTKKGKLKDHRMTSSEKQILNRLRKGIMKGSKATILEVKPEYLKVNRKTIEDYTDEMLYLMLENCAADMLLYMMVFIENVDNHLENGYNKPGFRCRKVLSLMKHCVTPYRLIMLHFQNKYEYHKRRAFFKKMYKKSALR